jgi:acetolactate synthase II small subunit
MFELTLLIASNEGALIRVLGTIERRGFALGSMTTQRTAQGVQLSMTLSSDGRAADVLLRQLRRLVDVRDASLDMSRPAFKLPPQPSRAANSPIAASNRRGLSFLGLPDRISEADAVYA